MKLKYRSCIRSFILFVIFNILSMITFAIPEGMKPDGSEEPIPPVIKKNRAITSSFDSNEGDGFIIQDRGSGNIIVNKKNLVNGSNSITPKLLNVGGNTNNAFGYNPSDNYIYGIQMVTDSGHNLIKIGKDGQTVGFSIGKITGVTKNESIYIGDFDKNGNMYVAGDNNIYRLSIVNGAATATNIGNRTLSHADWGYTEINGKERFYLITNNGTLYYYEKSGLGLIGPTQAGTGLTTDGGTVVAIFMAGTNMFYNPSGTNKIYKVDLTATTPASILFTTLDNTTSSGDGARNYLQLIPNLAVGKEVLNGTLDTNGQRIFSQGDEIKYRLVIKNSGNYPLGADDNSKYTVSDQVDLNKVESMATNVVAKKFTTLTGGTGTIVNSVPVTLTYDSTGKFELTSESGKLPRLEIGERLEIEYNLKIRVYSFTGDTDNINNTVTGKIPNKQVTSSGQASVVILKPMVTALKTSSEKGTAQPGDVITYTIELTNSSKVDAKNYGVYDNLLESFIESSDVIVSPSATGGTLTGNLFEKDASGNPKGIIDKIGANGGKVTITYQVKVPVVIPSGITEIPNKVLNSEVKVPIDTPKVTALKTSSEKGTAQPGDVITYTIELTNNSKVDAKNYGVYDNLLESFIESGDVIVSPSATGGTLTGNLFEKDANGNPKGIIDKIGANGGKVTITYQVKVPAVIPPGITEIPNKVLNSEVKVPIDMPKVTALKTSSEKGTAQPGDVITYTIELTNNSKVDAKNYGVYDNLLESFIESSDVIVSPSATGGTLTGNLFEKDASGNPKGIIDKIGANGGKVTITYQVKVPVVIPSGITEIPNKVLNSEVKVPIDTPKVTALKTSSEKGTAQPGDVITYTIELTNNSKVDAKNYGVYDNLLESFIESGDVIVSPSATGGTLTGNLFEKDANGNPKGIIDKIGANGGKVTITYQVKVPAVIPPGITEIPNKVLNSEVKVPIDMPKVTALKTSSEKGTAQPGDVITYTIELTNNSKVDAKNYGVYDNLLESFIESGDVIVSPSATGGTLTGNLFEKDANGNPKGIIDKIGANGGKVTITYQVKVPAVIPPGITEIPNKVLNSEVKVPIDMPKVTALKTSSEKGTAQPGDVITYTIELTNSSKVDAKNYGVYDNLLESFIESGDVIVSPSATGGTLTGNLFEKDANGNPKGIIDKIGANGGKVTITYQVKVPAVIPPGITEIPNKVLNSEVKVPIDTLKVTALKTSSEKGTAQPGDVITYTIELTNSSKVDAKNYGVYDNLLESFIESGDVIVSPSATGGTLTGNLFEKDANGNPKGIIDKIGANGGKVTITYQVKVPAVIPPGITEIPNKVLNSEVKVPIDTPKVTALKTSSEKGTAQPGDVITYTIELTNNSKVDAKNYGVYDNLLESFIESGDVIVSPSATGGTLTGNLFEKDASGNPKGIIDKIGANGGKVTITYQVKVPAVIPPGITEIPNKVLNSEVKVPIDTLKVTALKTSSEKGTAQPGDIIAYTIELTNNSKVDAKNYGVYDNLLESFIESGDVIVSPSATGGTLTGNLFEKDASGNPKGIIDKIGANGGKVTITYQVKVPAVIPPGITEIPNKVLNSEVKVPIDTPKVLIEKTSNKTGQVVQSGDEIIYTITLTNNTNVEGKDYLVKDTLLNNPLITKPTVTVVGGTLSGDIFGESGGKVTVPAQVGTSPGLVTISYKVMVPKDYPNPTIINSVNNGDEVVIEYDEPSVTLRHDVFSYNDTLNDTTEIEKQENGIITDFNNIDQKNSNPPVIFPGDLAIHYLSLINTGKAELKGKNILVNHQLDGKTIKDDNGNPAFSKNEFTGIVITDLDSGTKDFYTPEQLGVSLASQRAVRSLPSPTDLEITVQTSSFTFAEKIPARTAISFVFLSTVNSEGNFTKNNRIATYDFLPIDSSQNTSEGELRKAVIVIGRREADLVLSKSVEVEEASIGKFVPYTIEVKNMGQDPVDNIIISDKLPPGFTYVEGSAVQELKDGYVQKKLSVTGTKEIEIGPISQIGSGETIVIKYLLKVGVGVKPGTYKNIAVVKNENKENVSNTDSVDIDIVADPIFEHTTVIGKVFHDRDRDGIQDYADAKKSHITVNIPKEYYVKNTTTVSKDGKIYSFADNYETITIRNIKGRVSELEPATNNMVVIRKELVKPIMANVRVQTFGGTDITQQGNGEVITNHTGDKIKGMTSQDIVVTQRVIKNKDNKIILEIFILNNGIQEEGLPGVRLATPEGIVVETDRFGRYHVPPVPETLGKNYIIKVDPTTLPKGAEFTTENPRVRHLGKVMMKFNFGVKLPPLKNPEKKDN
ncbi:DUF11 domain-containing protein [Cetobacterium sp. 2G large]|uniref:DUF6923 family protein n=1 Tax=Cetobacterium sp. 2G large TaxID=2759680 RepID=UPI00163D37A3|nr:DUF11 domain-containing protein [Cetobacterium sp. 2G large]MBC2854125.1 DUF11 domain-containing protein [Cetobacterium sp. 2G large]